MITEHLNLLSQSIYDSVGRLRKDITVDSDEMCNYVTEIVFPLNDKAITYQCEIHLFKKDYSWRVVDTEYGPIEKYLDLMNQKSK